TEMVGADVSTVSKHLSLLKESGLVEYDKRGTQIFYSLAAPCVLNFFDCLEALLHNQMHKQLAWMNG
ncbi:MAG: ArsR/SmtB family transcription factor, partial [Desulfovermiculus sp.]